MSIRAFVALTRLPDEAGYQAVPLIAVDLAAAEAVASQLSADVIAVLAQEDVTALGMALAMGRATIEHRESELPDGLNGDILIA